MHRHLPVYALIGGSILLGSIGDWLCVLYLKYVGKQIEIAILVISIILINLAHATSLELLLPAIVIGFIVENHSQQGPTLIRGLERISLPVYIIFFALAGASVNLPLLLTIGIPAIIWTGVRGFGILAGTLTGMKLTGERFHESRLTWLGYLPQAGVALGMASLVADSFPGWGNNIRTLVLAVVAINQVVGPIAFRYALVKSGEAGKAEE